jgi:hypothetical protein
MGNGLFRVWKSKERAVGQLACPECGYLSADEYCGRCGSYLHPDHIQFRKDEQFREWVRELEARLVGVNFYE